MKLRMLGVVVLITVVGLFSFGCSSASNSVSSPSAGTSTMSQFNALGQGQVGGMNITIYSGNLPPVTSGNEFQVLLTNSAGIGVSGATVTFNTNMTNMNMGDKMANALELGNGYYGTQISFSMPGPWRVIVSVQVAGQTNTIQFNFQVNS